MSQVTIEVLYFGPILETVAVPDEIVQLPAGSTVNDLLGVLGQRHGHRFLETLLLAEDRLVPNATILLDGHNILHRQALDTVIPPDASTHILLMTTAVGGG